jgi:putative transposase
VKKSRYTEEQIAYALKQAETGTPVAEVIRRMGVSEQNFTAGRRSTAGWASVSHGACNSSRWRTAG